LNFFLTKNDANQFRSNFFLQFFCKFQIVLSVVLIGTALALPSGGPPPPYGPPPPIYGEVKIPPRPFAYAYGVSDNYSGANFDKKETQVRILQKTIAQHFSFLFEDLQKLHSS
jgi:hypothetical protein